MGPRFAGRHADSAFAFRRHSIHVPSAQSISSPPTPLLHQDLDLDHTWTGPRSPYPPSMFAQRAPISTMANNSAAPPAPPPPAPPTPQPPAFVDSGFFSRRSLQQFSIFAAGAGFFFFSTMVTRRSIARKKLASLPKFYSPSHAAAGKQGNPEGNLIAIEALNLATLNVMSAGIMTFGGIAWAFDLSSVEELRERTRKSIHGEAGNLDEKAEREFEEWAAKILTQFGKTAPAEGAQEKPKEDKKN